MLCILDRDWVGKQRRPVLLRYLVESVFGTSGVEIRALAVIVVESPVCFILCAETCGAVDWSSAAKWDDIFLDIVGVVSQIVPRLAVGDRAEFVVDLRNAFGRVQVGNIPTEVPKVRGTVVWIPVQLLPCIRRIVERSAD